MNQANSHSQKNHPPPQVPSKQPSHGLLTAFRTKHFFEPYMSYRPIFPHIKPTLNRPTDFRHSMPRCRIPFGGTAHQRYMCYIFYLFDPFHEYMYCHTSEWGVARKMNHSLLFDKTVIEIVKTLMRCTITYPHECISGFYLSACRSNTLLRWCLLVYYLCSCYRSCYPPTLSLSHCPNLMIFECASIPSQNQNQNLCTFQHQTRRQKVLSICKPYTIPCTKSVFILTGSRDIREPVHKPKGECR